MQDPRIDDLVSVLTETKTGSNALPRGLSLSVNELPALAREGAILGEFSAQDDGSGQQLTRNFTRSLARDFVSFRTVNFAENTAWAIRLEEIEGATGGFAGGADKSRFHIRVDSGSGEASLDFFDIPDFENPHDADRNNIYEVVLKEILPEGGFVLHWLTIVVTDVPSLTLVGTDGGDVLRGADEDDILDGRGGPDTMYGGRGDDIYYVDHPLDEASEPRPSGPWDEDPRRPWTGGTDTVIASADHRLGEGIENLRFVGTDNLIGHGNDLDNHMSGNDGHNFLDGSSGNDIIEGGAGRDTLDGGPGHNLLFGGAGDDSLEAGNGNDTLHGQMGNDTLIGANRGDHLYGGKGNDVYHLTRSDIFVQELENEGIDRVVMTGKAGTKILYTLPDWIEELELTGTAVKRTGIGNDLDNRIISHSGSGTLQGLEGSDTLVGGTGRDRLDGGSGADVLRGGAGDDIYIVDDARDRVIETAGGGSDRVLSQVSFTLGAHVEHLTLIGPAALNATGNAQANLLTGNGQNNGLTGKGGHDTLLGGAGRDTLSGDGGHDLLDGGTGADRMIGGRGNDIYIVDNLGDLVIEARAGGTDLVRSSVNHGLSDWVENLELTGLGAIAGAGNALRNRLTGNDGNNTLSGGAGDDTLQGGRGADALYGGSGADLFILVAPGDSTVAAPGRDIIHDFSQSERDRINLSQLDANSLIIGDQAFTLLGTQAFTGVAGELRFEHRDGQTIILGDMNGDRRADFSIQLDDIIHLRADDFVL